MTQQDSIAREQPEAAEIAGTDTAERPQHPQEELRTLPAVAAPAERDSAIQAAGSTGTDTLRLPVCGTDKAANEVSLPQYYRENFFASDSLLHPEHNGARYGVAGDNVPYTMRGDNVITILLMACFILAVTAFSRSRRLIAKQARTFFYAPRHRSANVTETSAEVRFQFFLVFQTCLLFSLLQYIYTIQHIGDTFILASQYHLIAIFFGMYAGYFLMRGAVYTAVNAVFFGVRKNMQWLKALLFITSMEGLALFPAVLLRVYFSSTVQSVATYVIIVLALTKILTFYKCYLIFFKRLDGYLQIILYFCALEIVPAAALWGALVMTGNYLKINF